MEVVSTTRKYQVCKYQVAASLIFTDLWQLDEANRSFVETPRKFGIAKLSIRKLGSSSVPIMTKIISKIVLPLINVKINLNIH